VATQTDKRTKREKKLATLLHASNDMIEASVAAEWLGQLEDNPWRAQVLITGMVVTYGRIFVRSADYKLDRALYKPADVVLADLHDSLIWWRDKVYAHTDDVSGRTAAIMPRTATSGPIIEWTRKDFPRAQLDQALALFKLQRKRFEAEAESLRLKLDE
jgi:hypothetical protein